MEAINNMITKFQNLSRMKQVILVIMVLIIIIFIYDIYKSNFNSDNNLSTPSKKNSNKVEKLDPKINISSGNVKITSNNESEIKLDTEKTNITLYFADWCGHCKQFISSTWGKVKENYSNNQIINLNEVDCTNIKSEIKTAAGMPIKGFPTVIINYKNADGEYIEEEYSGNRSYSAFSNYLNSLSA